MNTPSRTPLALPTRREAASMIVLVMITIAVLSVIAGSVLTRVGSKYHGTLQAQSWQEALQGAESGIDLGIAAVRNQLRPGGGAWTGWTVDGTTRSLGPIQLSEAGQGMGSRQMDISVTVDQPNGLTHGGYQWFRIRAVGTTQLPGPAITTGESFDARLRRLSLRFDPLTGNAVAGPVASRMVEAIVRPVASVNVAMLAEKAFRMNNHNIWIDSYNSEDPDMSTNGNYPHTLINNMKNSLSAQLFAAWMIANGFAQGHVATNGQLIEAGSAHVFGDALTNNGTVTGAGNVTGEQRSDFYRELLPMTAPTWTSFNNSPASVSDSATLVAGSPGTPQRYKLTSITMSGQNQLTISNPTPGQEAHVEIWVTGNIALSGNARIVLQQDVRTTIYFAGNADFSGQGIINHNNKPKYLHLYGIEPADPNRATERGTLTIAGNGGFNGVTYAPGHNLDLRGGGNSDSVYGAFVARDIFMNGVTSVHFDLALETEGAITDYVLASWYEVNPGAIFPGN